MRQKGQVFPFFEKWGEEFLKTFLKNGKKILTRRQSYGKIVASEYRGVSAVGSAQHWQCWGQGFESPTLHQTQKAPLRCLLCLMKCISMMKIPAQAACGLCHSVRKRPKHRILLSAHAWVQNPLRSTNKNRTFVGRQMFCFCLSKPQAWHIIAARSTVKRSLII